MALVEFIVLCCFKDFFSHILPPMLVPEISAVIVVKNVIVVAVGTPVCFVYNAVVLLVVDAMLVIVVLVLC